MSDPVISPDGKFMWTGSDWIPAPPTETLEENKIDTSSIDEIVGFEVRDSVVMGNISINDVKTECVQCKSTGVTQIGCLICKEKCFCSVCESEVMDSRNNSISYNYNNQRTGRNEVLGRYCNSCFIEERAKLFDSICTHCKVYFDSISEERLTSPKFGCVPNPSHCYSCQKMARLISKWKSRMRNPTGNAVPKEYQKYLDEAERKWDEASNKCNTQPLDEG